MHVTFILKYTFLNYIASKQREMQRYFAIGGIKISLLAGH